MHLPALFIAHAFNTLTSLLSRGITLLFTHVFQSIATLIALLSLALCTLAALFTPCGLLFFGQTVEFLTSLLQPLLTLLLNLRPPGLPISIVLRLIIILCKGGP
jgi:hypothetical protein